MSANDDLPSPVAFERYLVRSRWVLASALSDRQRQVFENGERYDSGRPVQVVVLTDPSLADGQASRELALRQLAAIEARTVEAVRADVLACDPRVGSYVSERRRRRHLPRPGTRGRPSS